MGSLDWPRGSVPSSDWSRDSCEASSDWLTEVFAEDCSNGMEHTSPDKKKTLVLSEICAIKMHSSLFTCRYIFILAVVTIS